MLSDAMSPFKSDCAMPYELFFFFLGLLILNFIKKFQMCVLCGLASEISADNSLTWKITFKTGIAFTNLIRCRGVDILKLMV